MSMNVFKIQQAGTSPGKSEKKIEAVIGDAVSSTGSVPEPEVVTDPTQSVVTTGEMSAAPLSINPGENPAGKSPSDPSMMVKVDGPVGRVFTDALNKMLALEGYLTLRPDISADHFTEDSPEEALPENLVQVYCWRTDAVNTSDLVHLTNNITRHTDRQFVIAMESTGTLANGMGVLESLQKMPNVKLCYSVESAIQHIKGKLA